MHRERNMTLIIHPITKNNHVMFHGFIEQRPEIKRKSDTVQGLIDGLTNGAKNIGLSGLRMDYGMSFKTEPEKPSGNQRK